MAKQLTIGLFALCALFGFGIALYMALTTNEEPTSVEPVVTETLPVTGASQPAPVVSDPQSMSVRTKEGSFVTVHDIRKDVGVEKQDYRVDGPFYVFYFEQSVRGVGGYQLLFEEQSQSFLVTLFAEPVPILRERALEKLRASLGGISKDTLCRLAVSVRVVDNVRPQLTDVELGVPECGGMYIDTL